MNTIDLIIVAIYLTGIFAVGYYLKSYVNSFNDFMIANSKMGVALGVASMAGTELGLITVMYNAEKGWTGQFASFHIGLIAFLVTLAIGLSGFVISKLRDLNVKSIPEFYNIRYGKDIRVIGAIFLILAGVLNMGVFLITGAKFLKAVLGSHGVELNLIMTGLLILVLFYTMMGGMLSVIITDYIQFVILSIGLFIATFISIYKIGWVKIFHTFEQESAFNPILNSDFGYDYIVWMVIIGFGSAVIWPTATTRALAMKDSDSVKKQYMWSSVSFLIRFIIPSFLGICAFIYFSEKGIDGSMDSLEAMPKFLVEILPVGILGLVVAGMLSAFMSTNDSYLLCWSTIITNDIISPLAKQKLSSSKKIFISQIIIILLGAYIFYWGLNYTGEEDIWDYLAITGSVYFSGAISLVVFGLYSNIVNKYGAYCSLLCGLIALLGLSPIKSFFNISVSSEMLSLIGLFSAVVMIFLGSFYGQILFEDNDK